MFTINSETNRITPIEIKRFSDLGFTERKNLQEWLAHQPDSLGEELLIIQKEFDGFDDTRERLDLLAIDKDGNLVIIENKLDDSGRDVVWQSLKYASYCSNLTKGQIVDIYQKYLNRYETKSEEQSSAQERICEFLDSPDLDEVKLNSGNSQRVMLVAANFRKEVTSTALWLIGQGISIQCFKVTPYQLGTQLLIDIDQIIPTPESKELMIGINAKESEEKSTERVQKSRHIIRHDYWERLLEVFQNSKCNLYNNISPAKDHWLSAGSGLSGCTYTLIFGKKELRVSLEFNRPTKEENKFLFDFFSDMKDEIESSFGDQLEWLRLDDKKSSRLQYSCFVNGYDKETWDESVQWHLENMIKLENVVKGPLLKASDRLKQKE